MEQLAPQAPVSTSSRPMMPPVGTLFSETWQDYKARIGTYTGIQALSFFLAIVGVLVLFLLFFLGSNFFNSFAGSQITVIVVGALGIFIALVLMIALSVWLQATLLYAVSHSREQAGIKTSFSMGWKMARSYFWVMLLGGLLGIGSFFLFIIPGIMFLVWFLLAPYVLATEGDRGMSSLVKSRLYVKEYFWPVVGRFLLFYIMMMFALYVPTMIFEAFELQVLSGLYSLLFQLMFAPLFSVYLFRIYEQLKAIKGPIQLNEATKRDKRVILWIAIIGWLMPVIGFMLMVLIPLLR